MVTRLIRRTRDPNGLGRGPGFYYLRGGKRPSSKNHTYKLANGQVKTITGPYYSKYSQKRDTQRLSNGWQVNKIGVPKNIASKFAHVSDGNLIKKIRR